MSKNITIPVPAVPFAPPVYTCHRAKKEFHLDGNINKPFWEDAPYTDEFLDIQGSHMPLPRFVTRAKMLWDDENLYVAADLAGDEIWGHLTERDSVIYFDNDFEIFVDPDSDTYHYYEFEMNVLNTVWDLFLAEPYRDGGSGLNGYDMHGLRTAVHVDGSINDPSAENKGWSVEVVIPFSALYEYQKERRAPKNGEFYRMNFSRVQWNVDVKDNSHFQLAGIMRGNLFVSGSATAEITGSIFADEILDSGRLTIYGLVTSTSGPYHANMRPGAYVNMILH